MRLSTCPIGAYVLCTSLLLLLPRLQHAHPIVKRCASSNVDSRALCLHGSCEFYTHCIDSALSCGPFGFSQAYGHQRCENLRQLNATSNSSVVRWMAGQDKCLQSRLLDVISEQFNSSCGDSPTCLEFEGVAFDELQVCYQQSKQELCDALKEMDAPTFLHDIPLLLGAISISDYYSSIASEGLEKVLRSCGTLLPIEALFPEPKAHRYTFCIAQIGATDKVITTLAEELGTSQDLIEDLGEDGDWRCLEKKSASDLTKDPDNPFHLVAWYPGTNVTQPNITSESKTVQQSPSITVVYFLFDILYTNTTCGDGIRQAGELCDLGIYNGAHCEDEDCYLPPSQEGCNAYCKPVDGYECSVDQLQPSNCTLVSCGDGHKASTEVCDDGNSFNGDGCSSVCMVEPGYECSIVGSISLCKTVPSTTTTPPPTPTIPITSPSTPSSSSPPTTSEPQEHPSPQQLLNMDSLEPSSGRTVLGGSHVQRLGAVAICSLMTVLLLHLCR